MSLLHHYSARSGFPRPLLTRHGVRGVHYYVRAELETFARAHGVPVRLAGEWLARYWRSEKRRRRNNQTKGDT